MAYDIFRRGYLRPVLRLMPECGDKVPVIAPVTAVCLPSGLHLAAVRYVGSSAVVMLDSTGPLLKLPVAFHIRSLKNTQS